MMGSNMKVLRQSIGPHVLERVKTCEFHFKDCRNRQARELREEDTSCFKLNYTIVSFEAESPVSYNKAKKDLISMKRTTIANIYTRVEWWHQTSRFFTVTYDILLFEFFF